MPHLAWGTDVHFDHCSPEVFEAFAHHVKNSGSQGLCLTGDISEGPTIVAHLKQLSSQIDMPLYCILGNHDYYHSSISEVRAQMQQLPPSIHWMPTAGVIPLSESTCLIGHDGWSDAQHGDYESSTIRLKDYRLIQELAEADKAGQLQNKLQALGRESARSVAPFLAQALNNFQHLIFLTHAPPFREACLYGTEVADDNWAPHFTCKALGDLLLQTMEKHPHHHLTVLAGHTHNPCDIQLTPQIRVKVGQAEYGSPALQRAVEFP